MESSRVTETTVASATRMRGTSYSPCSSSGAAQTSTTLPASTDAGTSTALRTTTLVVRACAASPTARGRDELAGGDRARRDQPVGERVGREVGAAELAERDVDDLEIVVG